MKSVLSLLSISKGPKLKMNMKASKSAAIIAPLPNLNDQKKLLNSESSPLVGVKNQIELVNNEDQIVGTLGMQISKQDEKPGTP